MSWVFVGLVLLITAAHVGYLWDVFSGRHATRAEEMK